MPFKLSTKGHYAVLLMYELARSGNTPVSLSKISRLQKVSPGYLEQIVRPLKENGLVKSARGARGGYQLTRPPGQITVGQIVRVVEGPVAPVSCVTGENTGASCPQDCRARIVWKKVTEAIDKVLDSISLEDLINGVNVQSDPEGGI